MPFIVVKKHQAENEISDIKMWNRKHGTMWIIYGIIIILAWGCGFMIGDSILLLFPMVIGLIFPVIVMIWYHRKLIKIYKVK